MTQQQTGWKWAKKLLSTPPQLLEQKKALLFSQDTACQSRSSYASPFQRTGHPEICHKTTASLALPCLGLFSLSKRFCVRPKRIYTLRYHEKDRTLGQSLRFTHASPVLSQSKAQLSTVATGEAPCGAHVFEGFFGLENGPVKSDKSQEKTLFGKEMPEDASRHPKPTSYPQTRQDTVVRVFPMESSN